MSSSSSPKEAAPAARKSKGRQKVIMVKMENHSNLQVTFSKRRAGLFKKASELCTLCAAEAAIVVFSPAGKVYCFGHPDVQTVVDRLIPPVTVVADPTANPRSRLIIEAHRNSSIRELNMELTHLESLLRAEKRRGEDIEGVRKAGREQRMLPASLDDLDLNQLAALKESVEGFKNSFDAKVQEQMMMMAQPLHQNQSNIPTSFYLAIDPPAFDFPTNLSLGGVSAFSPYFNGQTPLNNLVGGVTNTYSGRGSAHDYLRASIYGSSGAMIDVNGASSSSTGSGGMGFVRGHGHGLFQM